MKKRKLKMKNIFICIIILVFIIVGIVFLVNNKSDKKQDEEVNTSVEEKEENIKENIINKKSITIKIGDEIPSVLDYISEADENTYINWDNLKTENKKAYYTGTFKGKIEYNSETIDVELIVLDEEKPVIDGVKDITIYVGDKVDLFSNIKITDNSYDELSKGIAGKYNVDKVGTYNLKYEVSDKAGNKITKDFRLIVKEKEVSNSNSNNNTDNTTDKTGTTSKGYKIERKNGIYYINGILIANKSYNLPSSYNPGGLTSTFNAAFKKLQQAASADGINIWIKSGYRSYATQTTLYNNYVARDGKAAADRYSARAGYSEHQTGLAADFNEISDTFGETKAGKWLANNCWKYGFILRYPKGKESKTGYMYESWHFRYIGDVELAKTLYNNGNWITLEEYLGIDSKYGN